MSKFGIEEELRSNWQPVLQCQILVTKPIAKATYHLSGILKCVWWLGRVYYTFQCFGYLDTASNWCEEEEYDLLWNLPEKKVCKIQVLTAPASYSWFGYTEISWISCFGLCWEDEKGLPGRSFTWFCEKADCHKLPCLE